MRHYEFYVYMMASISKVIYIGVTNHLYGRVQQHKEGVNEGFTKKYKCNKLVYYEEYKYIDEAIEETVTKTCGSHLYLRK